MVATDQVRKMMRRMMTSRVPRPMYIEILSATEVAPRSVPRQPSSQTWPGDPVTVQPVLGSPGRGPGERDAT